MCLHARTHTQSPRPISIPPYENPKAEMSRHAQSGHTLFSWAPHSQNTARLQKATQLSEAGFQNKNQSGDSSRKIRLLPYNAPHRAGLLPGTTCSQTQPEKALARGHALSTGGAGTLPGTPGKLEARGSLPITNTHEEAPLCRGPETLPSHKIWIAPMGTHSSSRPTRNAPRGSLEQPLIPHKKQYEEYLAPKYNEQ